MAADPLGEAVTLRRLEPDSADPRIGLLAKSFDVVIAFDTEYVTRPDGSQDLVSYQFAILNPQTGLALEEVSTRDDGVMHPRFRLQDVIACVLDRAESVGLIECGPKGAKVRVALVAHFGRADLPSFLDFEQRKQSFDSVRKCYVTLTRPYLRAATFRGGAERAHTLKVSVTLFDTMLLLPQGCQSLDSLGHLLGLPKLTVPEVVDEDGVIGPGIERMDLVLAQHPQAFADYAVRDGEVTMRWFVETVRFFEGFGMTRMPKTIAGAALQRVVRYHGGGALCLTLGKGMTCRDTPGEYLPQAAVVHALAANAFHGGRNEAFISGIATTTSERPFVDYDVKGAYSAAMAHLRPLDWDRVELCRDPARLSDLAVGLAVMTVRFRFPDGTAYPSLPVEVGAHGLLYPLSGLAHITSPELRVALDQGCQVEVIAGALVPWSAWPAALDPAAVEREIVGFQLDAAFSAAVEGEPAEDVEDWFDDPIPLPPPTESAGGPPRPFEAFTKAVNRERARHPKGSPREQLAKTVGNAAYGKTGQGVSASKMSASQKKYFDTRSGEHVPVPESALSSPLIAATITGLVRALLSEILARLPAGVRVLSVTTDGFLSDATPDEIVHACAGPVGQLFADLRRRVDLDGDPDVLEEKGRLLKVYIPKTRGCFPIETADAKGAGRLARVGPRAETPFTDPMAESAHWLELARTRTYETVIAYRAPQAFTCQYRDAAPLLFETRRTRVNLDYDLKRQPVTATDVDGLVALTTRPWRCPADFKAWREALTEWGKTGYRVLKTSRDWHDFVAWRETCAGRRGAPRRRAPFEHLLVAAVAYGLFPRGVPPQDRADALTIAGVEGVTPAVLKNFRRSERRDDAAMAALSRLPGPTTADAALIRRFKREFTRLLKPRGRPAQTRRHWNKLRLNHATNQSYRTVILDYVIQACGLSELTDRLENARKTPEVRGSDFELQVSRYTIGNSKPLSRTALAATHAALRREFGLRRQALKLAQLYRRPHTVESAIVCLARALVGIRRLKLDLETAVARVVDIYEEFEAASLPAPEGVGDAMVEQRPPPAFPACRVEPGEVDRLQREGA